MRGTEEIVIHAPKGRDPFGVVGSVTAPVTVQGCAIWPVTGTERDVLNEDNTVVLVNCFVPPGIVIDQSAEVFARGQTWQVDGQTEDFVKHGQKKGRIYRLKRRV